MSSRNGCAFPRPGRCPRTGATARCHRWTLTVQVTSLGRLRPCRGRTARAFSTLRGPLHSTAFRQSPVLTSTPQCQVPSASLSVSSSVVWFRVLCKALGWIVEYRSDQRTQAGPVGHRSAGYSLVFIVSRNQSSRNHPRVQQCRRGRRRERAPPSCWGSTQAGKQGHRGHPVLLSLASWSCRGGRSADIA